MTGIFNASIISNVAVLNTTTFSGFSGTSVLPWACSTTIDVLLLAGASFLSSQPTNANKAASNTKNFTLIDEYIVTPNY